MDKHLISGSTTLLILSLLAEKDMYGYEMIDALARRSENIFELKTGTLYPLLHQLVRGKYLASYEAEVNKKKRKYYHITDDGKNFLREKKQEWETYSGAVSNIIGGVSYGH